MKKSLFAFAAMFALLPGLIAGVAEALPAVKVKDMKGKSVSASAFQNDGKPFIMVFWATWCAPCKNQLSRINQNYADWQSESGSTVKAITISIDDAQTSSKVALQIKSMGWGFESYVDENSELKRAMGVRNVPFAALIDSSGAVAWSSNSYSVGDEDVLFEKFEKLEKGEPLE